MSARTTNVKATITIGENELTQIVRDRVGNLTGVEEITGVKFKVEYNRVDEFSHFAGVDVSVELKEKT